MAEYQEQSGKQLSLFFSRLSLTQKAMLAFVTIGALAAIVGLVTLVNRPSYGMLFSNVDAQDAAKVVEKLREKKVLYQLDDAGKTILVPKDQIYDLRLLLAGEGLPQSSTIGYEIFDRTNLGISDFVQKVNYRRALEGELARTILQLQAVEGVRVHIVVPQKALFKEDEKPATASVVLKLKSGKPLKEDAIRGIAHLISSSVEGMEPNHVSIIDSRGNLLSEPNQPNSLAATTSSQYELQQKIESYLARKAQTLLDGVLGAGNAIVQVNADLDFRQVDQTLEKYDAENPVVRSEQITEDKTSSKDSSPSSRTNSVTNYELNKTIERIVESVGGIKRLSVAAMINGTQKVGEKNGEKTTEYTPRPPEELNRLTEIIKMAVGFTQQRNDEISVVNLPFGATVQDQDFVTEQSPFADWTGLAEKVFLVIAMISAMLIVRSLLNRIRVQVGEPGAVVLGDPSIGDLMTHKKASIHLPSPEEEISQDVLLRNERRKKITEYVEGKPEEASRLIRVWLAQDA